MGAQHPGSDTALASAFLILCLQAAPVASSTGHFEVITPNPTVSILLGKEALLVCQLLPARNAEAMEIRWTQIRDDKEKLIYQKGRNEIQGEAYRGQTHLLTSAMQRGTVSLLIGNVTLADQGKYGCDFQSPDFFNSAEQELQVTSSGSDPHLNLTRDGNGGIQVTCLSAGWYPKPRLFWTNSRGETLRPDSEEEDDNDGGLFNLSSSLVVMEGSDPVLSCTVRPSTRSVDSMSSVLITDTLFPRPNHWRTGLIVFLLILCCPVIVFAVYLWRIHKAKGAVYSELGKIKKKLDSKPVFDKAAFEPVTLDRNTAHPSLVVSMDQRSVTARDMPQSVTDSPEKFDQYSCVLGTDCYTSGVHYWDVEVGDEQGWALGVTRESANRRGRFSFSPEQGTWAIQLSMGQYQAVNAEWSLLDLSQKPRKIRVYLDYDNGVVCFYDIDTMAPIHAFTASFSGKIYPFFWVWSVGTSLRLAHFHSTAYTKNVRVV
ncbi:butyrophilin subfamily 1 member A1-like [Alligator mississippiensis]|uniref:Butyrophilin subfamily 1 member A1-like n=1 Tax=Alligator mississippiensis TaxID=8496 RepID=A0A151MLZ0_ALLMI|nr:butyrophilin subfamily 1 member A1-like [Alligator mississippiensis]